MSDVDDFVTAALDASVFLAPRDHGLTREEILAAGDRAGFRPGELSDAMGRLQSSLSWKQPKYRARSVHLEHLWPDFSFSFSPDFRNAEAFEFVRREIIALAAEVGESAARLHRDVLVERGAARGLKRRDLDVAITVLAAAHIFEETDGIVAPVRGHLNWPLPSEQIASRGSGRDLHVDERKWLRKAHPIVEDILARRTDGRSARIDPLDAFELELESMGHGRFRAWWAQKRNELRLLDASLQPVATTVLAASLAEAALSFVVPRAQGAGLMKGIDSSKPRTWRFVDLVKGAKSGDPNVRAILDEKSAQRALSLNEARQRIHAGFLIDTAPTGPIPDLRPDEARDALQATDQVVRRVVDWLRESPTQ